MNPNTRVARSTPGIADEPRVLFTVEEAARLRESPGHALRRWGNGQG
jgi:hypothetical protein